MARYSDYRAGDGGAVPVLGGALTVTLRQESGIERREAMTAAEFERQLGDLGFPPAPVHQLTQLFECARYGNWTPTSDEEQQAWLSLQAILAHLHKQKTRN